MTGSVALDMLACHMLGDYVFQTGFQVDNKLRDEGALLRHATTYMAIFIIPLMSKEYGHISSFRKSTFLLLLWSLHALTDSRRWLPSPGWPPGLILKDQTLHVIQLAALQRILR